MRAALFQGPELSFDVAANLAAIASAAQTAAAAGASILVCPEMAATGYNIGSLIAERAEPADGPIAARIAEIARESGIAVVYGYPEADGGVVYNSVQVFDPSGTSTRQLPQDPPVRRARPVALRRRRRTGGPVRPRRNPVRTPDLLRRRVSGSRSRTCRPAEPSGSSSPPA